MTGRLARDGAWIALGHGAFALGQFAIAAALAKLAGVEAMAAFGLALAIGNPIYFLANMGLRAAIARDAAAEFAFADYWRARRIGALAAALAMAAAAIVAGYGRGFDGVAALLLFAAVKTVDAGFDALYGLRQRQGAAAAVARSLLLRAVAGPVGCLAALLATDGALWAALAGWALGAAAVFLAHERPALVRALAGPAGAGATAVIRQTWPLGLGAALASLETAIPRYVVEAALAAEALGYFTATFLFFQAATVVAAAFASAAVPHLGRAHAAGDDGAFARIGGGLAALGVAMGVVGVALAVLFGADVLALLYTDEYARYADILTVVMVAAAFRITAAMLQAALIAAGRFRLHLAVHIGLALLALALSPPLIDAYGLEGAAYTLLAVCAAQMLAAFALFAKLLQAMRLEPIGG